jgi:hypothetical protein
MLYDRKKMNGMTADGRKKEMAEIQHSRWKDHPSVAGLTLAYTFVSLTP